MDKECQLCRNKAVLVGPDMKGYIEGTVYDIYECSNCGVAFSNPAVSDPVVYDVFYQHADIVPGYERYQRYATLARKVRNPIGAITAAEPIYWSAFEAIKNNFLSKDISILEIGSGLGYFVYSLRRAGYRAVGLDISSEATRCAIDSFGDFYKVDDLFSFKEHNKAQYDCVLMLETIEHVENPGAFIEAALTLLKKDGVLIMTTPNKEQFTSAPWSMDPPVHLWSFTEKSIKVIAGKFGKDVSFIDFTDYTKLFSTHIKHHTPIDGYNSNPYRIKADHSLSEHFRVSKLKTYLFGVYGRHLLSFLLRRFKKKTISSKIPTLCAVIRNN